MGSQRLYSRPIVSPHGSNLSQLLCLCVCVCNLAQSDTVVQMGALSHKLYLSLCLFVVCCIEWASLICHELQMVPEIWKRMLASHSWSSGTHSGLLTYPDTSNTHSHGLKHTYSTESPVYKKILTYSFSLWNYFLLILIFLYTKNSRRTLRATYLCCFWSAQTWKQKEKSQLTKTTTSIMIRLLLM